MNTIRRLRIVMLAVSITAIRPMLAQNNQPDKDLGLSNLLGLHHQYLAPPHSGTSIPDAVAMGLASAKVYSFSTGDYPGGDQSALFDNNASTTVGVFSFTTGSSFAFTLSGG